MIDYTMRLALCDDEPEALEHLASLTRQIASDEGLQTALDLYHSGEELLAAIRGGARYHALLLDVMMSGMTGMALAAQLRASLDQVPIVFISSNREMALAGYEVSAIRYLAKPLDAAKLKEALMLCYHSGAAEEALFLPTSRGMRRISPASIVYAETWGRELRLTLADGIETLPMKLSDLEKLLPQGQFTMCHRTILVNLAYVKYLRYCELELKTGDTLPVSKYRQNAVHEKLFSYLE